MSLGENLTKDTSSDKPSDEEKISESQDAEQIEDRNQFCIFRAGKEEYAVPINLVKEVVPIPEIAPLPQMPNHILGMSNVRGNIFGIIDLGVFFRSSDDFENEGKYLLVIDHEVYQMGIMIPDVPDTMMVAESMIEQLSTSTIKTQTGQKYLKGIIKKDQRMIILFDILGLISSEKFTEVS
ncbi:MAG: purine-binding chemotaxis protein CheW [Ekhidna sp.]|nr:purine-binding chemotaxis protein CheW [Ekhidna sp.]